MTGSSKPWVLAVTLLVAGAFAAGKSDTASAEPGEDSSMYTPAEYRRGGDQTFLTYPEWFLVHSPAEYADYVETRQPTHFPFIGHIRQFWSAYYAMYSEVKDRFAFNTEYHVMLMVIGVSTSVEYTLKAAYETLIGRLTGLTSGGRVTPEDEFGARVARDYVDFIQTTPWYEFDYWDALTGLWRDTTFFGPDFIRKLERKYVLSSEYLVKAGYAWLIKKGAQSSFDAPRQMTVVAVKTRSKALPPGVEKLDSVDTITILGLPRYGPFGDAAMALASDGAEFVEVAGNRAEIMITVITDTSWRLMNVPHRMLFEQPILTQPGRVRHALAIPIDQLHAALQRLHEDHLAYEHIYDF